jgi:hypothetical protein
VDLSNFNPGEFIKGFLIVAGLLVLIVVLNIVGTGGRKK